MADWTNRFGCLTAFVTVLIAAPVGSFIYSQHRNTIDLVDLVPADLEVISVIYDKQKDWGTPLLRLPGDNETGLIVFGLPDPVAEKIMTDGVAYFNRPANVARRFGGQTTYMEWQETPLVPSAKWTASDQQPSRINIEDYLNKYGFGIEIDKGIEVMVNESLSTPGNYYSYGRYGLVIVIPKARRVVYTYAG
jgi:hypothetical protein